MDIYLQKKFLAGTNPVKIQNKVTFFVIFGCRKRLYSYNFCHIVIKECRKQRLRQPCYKPKYHARPVFRRPEDPHPNRQSYTQKSGETTPAFLFRYQQCTNVPSSSPEITRFNAPSLAMPKTTIFNLRSRQSANAVASITFRFLFRASSKVMVS